MIDERVYGKKNIDKSFYDFLYGILERSGSLTDFFKHLENKYRVILFGGSVRDFIVFNGKYPPRDLDVVIIGAENSGELQEILEKHFETFDWRHNQFGGLKITVNDVTLDCWRIEDTYAFRKGKMRICVEALLDTPMLNIDRYAYDMNAMQYIDNCNRRSLPDEIDFHSYEEELLEINLLRALVYSKKYSLKLSSAIKLKMKEVFMDENRKKKMIDLQLYHYKEQLIDLNRILQEL